MVLPGENSYTLAYADLNYYNQSPKSKLEPWRQQVYDVHDLLHTHFPTAPPEPIHETLGIDSKADPFTPAALSSTPGSIKYHQVRDAIFAQLAPRLQEQAVKVNRRHQQQQSGQSSVDTGHRFGRDGEN
ncbi:hypothetical protein FZEAL_5874 [Fusarium zealandicum]|uniref:Uncharacterized protein n=1 Tax=Fusarium zealandicum TaxID=1053134 RepID=A0A8H4XJD5_9HYPO|nr:hypothetical protein FZEAL_5874 [Fusarium zealandicum]